MIKEAERLAAQAFGAAHAFFMLNGTTGAVQAMIMAVPARRTPHRKQSTS